MSAHDEIDASSPSMDAIMILAALKARCGLLNDAETLLAFLLTDEPDDVRALRLSAHIAIERGDPRLAIERLERLSTLETEGGHEVREVLYARAYLGTGDALAARQSYHRYVSARRNARLEPAA